jgi:hypothetical protein
MGEILRIDQLEHFFYALGALAAIEIDDSVADIGGDTHMRKERWLLCDQRGVSVTRLLVNTTRGITQGVPVECDAADIRPIETCKKTQERALACTGGPKDHSPLRGEAALHMKMETPTARVNGKLKHGDLGAAGCRCRSQSMPQR